mgnify:FL=1
MKKGWLILGGAIVVGGAYAYYYYNEQIGALKNLDFKVIGYKIITANLDKASIQLTIRLTNRSVFEVKVEDFFVDVYLDEKKISDLQPVAPFLIPSKDLNGKPSYSDANIIVEFSPRQLGLDAIGFISGYLNKKDMNIRVVGSAKLKSAFVTLPVPVEYNTTLKEILSPT